MNAYYSLSFISRKIKVSQNVTLTQWAQLNFSVTNSFFTKFWEVLKNSSGSLFQRVSGLRARNNMAPGRAGVKMAPAGLG